MDVVPQWFTLNKWLLLKQQICVAWYLPNHSLLGVDWRRRRASEGWFLFCFKWKFAVCWSDWEDWQVIYYQDIISPPVWFQLHQQHKCFVDGYKQSITKDRIIFCVFHPPVWPGSSPLCEQPPTSPPYAVTHFHFAPTADGSSNRQRLSEAQLVMKSDLFYSHVKQSWEHEVRCDIYTLSTVEETDWWFFLFLVTMLIFKFW